MSTSSGGGPVYAIITGGAGGESLAGSGGDDIINAGDGNDVVSGNNGADLINGEGGDDDLHGNNGDDTLNGGAGADTLSGGDGTDTLAGGLDNDTYEWDGVDTLIELAGEGIDTVRTGQSYTLALHFENLVLTGSADISGIGNLADNVITGNTGANRLVGSDGNDTLSGLAGNDDLFGGEGNDTLSGGNDNDHLRGNEGTDVLNGGNGDDILSGGAGADSMTGGAGDDRYVVDDAGDLVIEASGNGHDQVSTSLHSYTLAANVEDLLGTATGGANQILNGNDGRNTITASTGDDIIDGRGGNDVIIGGGGNDRMTGGLGADVFVVRDEDMTLSTLNPPGNIGRQVDLIQDFDWAAGDRLDLSGIDANINASGDQAFSLVANFSGVAGQARIVYLAANNQTAIQLDVDGDGISDYQINIRAGDFTGVAAVNASDPANIGGWVL